MKRRAIKEAAQDALMYGLRMGISAMPGDGDTIATKTRDEAIRIFRRLEKQWGYEPGSHSPFV